MAKGLRLKLPCIDDYNRVDGSVHFLFCQVCQDHRSLVQLTAKVHQLEKGLGEQVLGR